MSNFVQKSSVHWVTIVCSGSDSHRAEERSKGNGDSVEDCRRGNWTGNGHSAAGQLNKALLHPLLSSASSVPR